MVLVWRRVLLLVVQTLVKKWSMLPVCCKKNLMQMQHRNLLTNQTAILGPPNPTALIRATKKKISVYQKHKHKRKCVKKKKHKGKCVLKSVINEIFWH